MLKSGKGNAYGSGNSDNYSIISISQLSLAVDFDKVSLEEVLLSYVTREIQKHSWLVLNNSVVRGYQTYVSIFFVGIRKI
jgi:hypothetical protein